MPRKIKLKCFYCKTVFKSKADIFRNLNNWALCEGCLYDDISEYWDDDCVEQILHDIKTRFNNIQ